MTEPSNSSDVDAALTHLERAADYRARLDVISQLQTRIIEWHGQQHTVSSDAHDLLDAINSFIRWNVVAMRATGDQLEAHRRSGMNR